MKLGQAGVINAVNKQRQQEQTSDDDLEETKEVKVVVSGQGSKVKKESTANTLEQFKNNIANIFRIKGSQTEMKGQRSRSQYPDQKKAKKESPIEDVKRGALFPKEQQQPSVGIQLQNVDAGSNQSFEDRPKAAKVDQKLEKVDSDQNNDIDSAHAECELDNFDPAEINDFFDGKTKKLS